MQRATLLTAVALVIVIVGAVFAGASNGFTKSSRERTGPVKLKTAPAHLAHPALHARQFVEGRTNPDKISVETAYRMFFRTLAQLNSQEDPEVLASYVGYALRQGAAAQKVIGLSAAHEICACDVAAVKTKRATLVAMVREYGLTTQMDVELPVEKMRSELVGRIGHDGASAIDHFVVNVVRRNTKQIY